MSLAEIKQTNPEESQEEWKAAARAAIRFCVQHYPEFSTDHVWNVVKHWNPNALTSDSRSLGSIMVQARRAGLIRSTNRFASSTRPECHQRPVRIWQRMPGIKVT